MESPLIVSNNTKSKSPFKKKYIINSEEDINKLSENDILQSKVYEFGGKYFDEVIMQKVLERENFREEPKPKSSSKSKHSKNSTTPKKNNSTTPKKNNSSKHLKIKTKIVEAPPKKLEFVVNKIIFQMQYVTCFGDELAVLGSINELGNWNQSGALRLKWNNGHVWKEAIEYKSEFVVFIEYKYIFLKDGKVKQWEDGNNRKFIWKDIKEQFEPLLKKNEKILEVENQFEHLVYDCDNKSLTIICKWNYKD